MLRAICLCLSLCLAASPALSQIFQTSAGPIRVEKIAGGFDTPWALAFLPNGRALVTERDGVLWHLLPDGGRNRVRGLPDVYASGQGGLLDVVVARDHAETGEIFLSYARPAGRGAQTAVAVARLNVSGTALEDLRVIFAQDPAMPGGRHFGSRVVERQDGTLWITTGDRAARDDVQDPANHIGKVIRIARDGTVPSDNPFVDGPARPEIWSIGHRNIQGAAMDETGQLWTTSHGARGGDEVNRPEPGRNYGWPVISYGRHYAGGRIGVGTAAEGLEQPAHYWDPSIAPSGLAIYQGALIPAWRGDLFIGSLKFDLIVRLGRAGERLTDEERLFEGAFNRIRDIRAGPDGALWFLAEGDGALYRAAPAP